MQLFDYFLESTDEPSWRVSGLVGNDLIILFYFVAIAIFSDIFILLHCENFGD